MDHVLVSFGRFEARLDESNNRERFYVLDTETRVQYNANSRAHAIYSARQKRDALRRSAGR